MKRWLARLRHDLIKHALWRARDLRDLGAAPTGGDLQALSRSLLDLRDEEGRPAAASALWRALREEAEADGAPAAALAAFGDALAEAEAAVRELPGAPWEGVLRRVLRLEAAFDHLARELEPQGG